jgi:hypothetical protein
MGDSFVNARAWGGIQEQGWGRYDNRGSWATPEKRLGRTQ